MHTNHPLGHPARPFLVYLTDNINAVGDLASDTAKTLWDGLTLQAEQDNCDLLAVVVASGHAAFSSRIHDLISPQSADGFVCWISVGGGHTESYFSRFANSQLISLSQKHAHHPVVAVANGSGIKGLLLHLVEVHGRKRIAFVRGPGKHPYAQERFDAYCEALAEAGLTYDEQLVTPLGPWEWQTGVDAVDILLDQRGLQVGEGIDAIMCASDRIAMGVLQALKKRGIRVPEDLAMTGFNNLLEARSSRPSLSTVAMPFERKSRVAVQWLMAALRGEVATQIELDSIVVLGESCGCCNRRIENQQRILIGDLSKGMTPSQACRSEILAIYPSFRHVIAVPELEVDALLSVFTAAMTSENPELLADWVSARIVAAPYVLMDLLVWQDILSVLRGHLPDYSPDLQVLSWGELAINKARLAVDDSFSRAQVHEGLAEKCLQGELRRINAELAYRSDVSSIMQVLERDLPSLGIPSAWVALFAGDNIKQASCAPEEARLLLAVERGQTYRLPPEGVIYPARELIPAEFCMPLARRNLVLHPLADGGDEFGFVIFEMGPEDGAVYESLTYSTGTALKAALLREDLRLRSEDLEQSLMILTQTQSQLVEAEKMAALGALVAGVAHEINTPVGVGVTAVSSMADSANRLRSALQERNAHAVRQEVEIIADGAELAIRNLTRAADLIESFKQIAVDQSSLKIRTFALLAYIEDVVKSLHSRLKLGGHSVDVSCDPGLEITCDPGAIAQIFTNLIQNSILHGFDGRQHGQISIACQQTGQGIEIDYRDDGLGMIEDVVEQIFLPFFTTKRGMGGSGLGMHVVYNLVTKSLGGSIHCESMPNQGARFLIRFSL